MVYFFVYKTRLKHSNKYYIGRHITKNLNDNYFGSGRWIKSIKNKNLLEKEIICFCDNEKDLLIKEKYYLEQNITNVNCMNFNNNSTGFASGHLNPNKDRLRRKILSQKNTGKNNPMYGKNHTSETKEKIRQSSLGRKHTEETKKILSEKISESRKGIKYSVDGRKKLSESRKKEGRKAPSFKNYNHKETSKQLIKEKALNREKILCIHCQQLFKPHTFSRWHGEKCKQINSVGLR